MTVLSLGAASNALSRTVHGLGVARALYPRPMHTRALGEVYV